MFTNDILEKVKTDIQSWTVNFVEASNEFYGGKFPVCPYARQARIKGETTYAIYPGGNLKQFIQHNCSVKLFCNERQCQWSNQQLSRYRWRISVDRFKHIR